MCCCSLQDVLRSSPTVSIPVSVSLRVRPQPSASRVATARGKKRQGIPAASHASLLADRATGHPGLRPDKSRDCASTPDHQHIRPWGVEHRMSQLPHVASFTTMGGVKTSCAKGEPLECLCVPDQITAESAVFKATWTNYWSTPDQAQTYFPVQSAGLAFAWLRYRWQLDDGHWSTSRSRDAHAPLLRDSTNRIYRSYIEM